ncbi:MAG: hypothetical protein MPJ50_10290 [Pirellulales bacterium]|nr:hypothetical protein [Pirellulales bacterium]
MSEIERRLRSNSLPRSTWRFMRKLSPKQQTSGEGRPGPPATLLASQTHGAGDRRDYRLAKLLLCYMFRNMIAANGNDLFSALCVKTLSTS